MVIVNDGTGRFATELASLVTIGEWGDDNTDPSTTDTDLVSPISGTSLTVSPATSGSSTTFTHNVGSLSANDNTFREFALKFTDGTLFLRAVGADIIKASGFEVETITQIGVVRG